MLRRQFVGYLCGSVPAAIVLASREVRAAEKKLVKIVEFNAAGTRTGVIEVEKTIKAPAEWKKQLTADQFQVTREAATEHPGSGKYANSHGDGLYHCICCNTVLFDSKTKFESGTGWPSFWQPVAKENLWIKKDLSQGMQRDEVLCTRCDAHGGACV